MEHPKRDAKMLAAVGIPCYTTVVMWIMTATVVMIDQRDNSRMFLMLDIFKTKGISGCFSIFAV